MQALAHSRPTLNSNDLYGMSALSVLGPGVKMCMLVLAYGSEANT